MRQQMGKKREPRMSARQILIMTTIIGGIVWLINANAPAVTAESHTAHQQSASSTMMAAGPPVIVYKTKADYYSNVAVSLSPDKSRILSFPDVMDVSVDRDLMLYPTRLHAHYLLSNRVLDKNSAFLNMTYSDYAALSKTPSPEEIYAKIIDKDPFAEMYFCGNRYSYKNLEPELNRIIDNNQLDVKCEKVK
jgi:hypothetical protein